VVPRYRVFEPETPRDLPVELVREIGWGRPAPPEVGEQWDLDVYGEWQRWEIVSVEDDPDPSYAGRIYYRFAVTQPTESERARLTAQSEEVNRSFNFY
jgi:hypothetical protein